MTWSYRVCKKYNPYRSWLAKEDCYDFDIREAYYNKDGTIWATTGEQTPYGESLNLLKGDLNYMKRAFKVPILDLDGLEYIKSDFEMEPAQSLDEFKKDLLGESDD